jgi:uncharacterized protein
MTDRTEKNASKNQVVWLDIPVTNLDRAIGFYSAVLGNEVLKETMQGPDGAAFSLGILPHAGEGVGGCLAVMKDTAPSDRGILVYFNCDGRLDQAVAAVEPNGGKVLMPKHAIGPHGYRALANDSEGNRIALHSN